MYHDKNEYLITTPHDLGYKSLLSQRQICLDFIQSFVPADWVKDIDEESLFEVSNEFVTSEFMSKKADKIFRLKLQEEEIYFYILQELQSTVDFLMPFRLLTYMVEIWRQIIDKAGPKANAKDFRLPVIIPIVLYNGKYNWTAMKNFKEMLDHFIIFEGFLPDFPYLLVDVNRNSREFLKNLSNTIGAIFLLDQRYAIIELIDRLYEAIPGIKTFETASYGVFKNWFKFVICDHIPPEKREELLRIIDQFSPQEANIMISNLSETIKEAWENAQNKGFEMGEKKGIAKIAKNMIKRNLPFDTISEVTELPLKEIVRLAEECKFAKE